MRHDLEVVVSAPGVVPGCVLLEKGRGIPMQLPPQVDSLQKYVRDKKHGRLCGSLETVSILLQL